MRTLTGSILALAMIGLAPATTVAQQGVEITSNTYQSRPRFTGPSTEWMGFAVANNGRLFRTDVIGTEPAMQREARRICERRTNRSCNNFIAVKPETDVIAIHCVQGSREDGFVGGSNQGPPLTNYEGARWLADAKARRAGFDPSNCRESGRH